jgi:hypothetical protein
MAVGGYLKTVKRIVKFSDSFDPKIKTLQSDFLGDDVNAVFDVDKVEVGDIIETEEEMEAYLRSSRREYTETIVYHTSSDYTQNFKRDELVDWFSTEYGLDDINFHFLILRDGRIQINKLINSTPPHTPVQTHLEHSISIAFVGGIKNGVQDIKSCSPKQWHTFHKFLKCFYTILPGGQVFGHSDINTRATDPGFDVVKYVENSFGKRNTLTNSEARRLGSLDVSRLIDYSRRRGFR